MAILKSLEINKSSMDLHTTDDPCYCMIEWHDKLIDNVEHIGIWLEDVEFIVDSYEKATLADYDGVFELPAQAIKLLKDCGIVVSEEFV